MNDLVGKILVNRYRVDAFLGRGGMAEVYKVWDNQRMVYLAMKVLHQDMAEDKIFLRRFRREAQTLAKLEHPHIIRFHGLEQDGYSAFMLMEYVDGLSLRTMIFDAGTSLPLAHVKEIMHAVCGALYYAHNKGMVHCDIKPANIMLDRHGGVRLADFGIARMTDGATATMVGAGTPAYMAPEQIHGKNPVPQTDVYALGVVLFEMLTGGERPFTGEQAQSTGSTGEKVRWEHLNLRPPSPRKWNSSIASSLEAVVMKCLAKDPAQRFINTLELFNELGKAIGHVPTVALKERVAILYPSVARQRQPTPPKRKHQSSTPKTNLNSLFIIGAMIFLVGMLFFFMMQNKPSISPPPVSTPPTLNFATTSAPISPQASNVPPISEATSTQIILSTYTATFLPTNTPAPTITSTPTISDPAEFVRWYFTALWQERNYEYLWENALTQSFRNHDNNFNQYADWGNSMERIDIHSVKILNNDGHYAAVQVNLSFYFTSGHTAKDKTYSYNLLYNEGKQSWMFDYR